MRVLANAPLKPRRLSTRAATSCLLGAAAAIREPLREGPYDESEEQL
jgi:hypothetical protein